MTRGPTIIDAVRVYRILRENPGRVYHYRDLAVEAGFPPTNVSTMMGRTVTKHPEYGFRRVGDGRSGQYVYRNEYALEQPKEPVEAPSAKLYEVIGFLPDKETMIVRADDGEMSVWRQVTLPQYNPVIGSL